MTEGAAPNQLHLPRCDHRKTVQSPAMRGLVCKECGEMVFPDVAAYYLDQLKQVST